ncbi:sec-independent protein translocase protein TATB, chloroplastic [Cryptomeria japonica]|uniref:sec-independent protein translocase protein TATB, chloroplastic n=1 Tax=Cryptomeria japonica TaxID=3369 RepID=UPI0025ABDD99|nr:sec-independent protein translocase protein TATB, chloroplastic [Cryptomeria japonica]XP_057866786.1 sec-independent protein translocase protein TATB, chloroplastic [Cryptomeria japonica]XP_057866787.1 sec-independent protein translocase protein TATB, chloroplastic [Cryptomeria japonica]
MATVTVAGPSALSLCKPSSACYCPYSVVPHSESTRKWAPPLSLFRDPKYAKKPFYRSGHSSFICLHSKFYLGQPLLLNAAYTGFRRQGRRRLVKASLFGVGAPEALVIGVVALLVFGPKGLAEVARTLGKSLRAFQPTIRELQEVSREFKNTLEQEIGLDELRSPSIDPSVSASQGMEREKLEQNGPPERKAHFTEDYLRLSEDEIKTLTPEEKSKVSTAENAELGGSSSATISPKQNIEDGKANDEKVV